MEGLFPWPETNMEQWRSHQPVLRSPFFSVDFSDVVASSGRNVDVLVGISGHQDVAYWPIEFCENRRAVPVGGLFNDEHGMVVAPDCPLRYSDVLSAGILDRIPTMPCPVRSPASLLILKRIRAS